jgi:drug/metabolite transporter (DMT)-like permease
MIDKKRVAAEAASEATRGFLNGLGFLLALGAIGIAGATDAVLMRHPIPFAVAIVSGVYFIRKEAKRRRRIRRTGVSVT